MKTETKVLLIIFGLTAVLIAGGLVLLGRGQSNSSTKAPSLGETQNINLDLGEKIGSDSAKVKLTEFSDFQCPACLAAEPTVESILKNHPADVELIYMNFPLSQHKNSHLAATAALEAAAEGKFEAMHDKLFATQNDWADLESQKATDFVADLGKQVGVDSEKIKQAIETDKYKEKITATTTEGEKLGVNQTPTFFIDGKKVTLSKSFTELSQAVDQELKSK